MKNKRATKGALKWIIETLNKYEVPFQISGGCAAKIYGSPRELNDIDIDIPRDGFKKITADVKPFVIYGPSQYKDGKWDLYLMTLNYFGQKIDVSSGDQKISTKDRKEWINFDTDFSKSVNKKFLGILVPVIPAEELINYKQLLDGKHQQVDIKSIKKQRKNTCHLKLITSV